VDQHKATRKKTLYAEYKYRPPFKLTRT